MEVAIDTSAVIAVIANEPQRKKLIQATRGADLIAPPSLHWEIGNAFSAMLRRKRIRVEQALRAVRVYRRIPIRFSEVELEKALELARDLDVYAYDAYVIACALKHSCPLLSLDQALNRAAAQAGARLLEVAR